MNCQCAKNIHLDLVRWKRWTILMWQDLRHVNWDFGPTNILFTELRDRFLKQDIGVYLTRKCKRIPQFNILG